jgi:Protein of unknown function (DUF3617)
MHIEEDEMRRMISLVAVLLSAGALLAAQTQTPNRNQSRTQSQAQSQTVMPLNIVTGLWQVTMTSTLKGLPPNTSTYKSCLRQEDLAQYPFTDPEAMCTWTVVSSTGSTMQANGTCMPGNVGKVAFDIQLTATDAKNITGTGQMTVNGPIGSMNGNYSGTAKWIGATCPAGLK